VCSHNRSIYCRHLGKILALVRGDGITMSRWKNQHPVEYWTYEDLVDYAEAYLLKSLLKGDLHSAVWQMLQLGIQWQKGKKK
jgi:hypothetical protein